MTNDLSKAERFVDWEVDTYFSGPGAGNREDRHRALDEVEVPSHRATFPREQPAGGVL